MYTQCTSDEFNLIEVESRRVVTRGSGEQREGMGRGYQ
jgi:hypothetical protein